MFERILIANRGEIALRIIRAARELGCETVCVYSEADKDGPWLEAADHAVCIGPGPAKDSYLRIDRIIAAAEVSKADAIHPGYGFLAERADFAEVCRDCEISFIGPSPEAMGLLGDKISAKKLAREVGTPIFPGTEDAVEDVDEAVAVAQEIGFPVIVKAAAGGGGRGMRIVREASELRGAIESASSEALAAFGSGAVYVEKFLEKARHVEVQCLGDSHGNAIHLFDRDCSSQRRHQKLIEEAPAPAVDPVKRLETAEAAARLLREAEYCGAATVEFLMDANGDYSMLEVNTRVQVEHCVTEMVTGIDIVQASILVAAGQPLGIDQSEVKLNGHSIECRINAEDPDRDFMPQAGEVKSFVAPGGLGVRMDSHVRSGYRIPPFYDSMIGKLIVHAPSRDEAITRMRGALSDLRIGPGKSTAPLHSKLLDRPEFRTVDMDIHWVERMLKED